MRQTLLTIRKFTYPIKNHFNPLYQEKCLIRPQSDNNNISKTYISNSKKNK